jgi:hypothetical protein
MPKIGAQTGHLTRILGNMIQFILRHRKKRLLFFVKRNPTNQKNEGI